MGMHNCIHSEADGDVNGDVDGVGDVDSGADSDGDAAVTRCMPDNCRLCWKGMLK